MFLLNDRLKKHQIRVLNKVRSVLKDPVFPSSQVQNEYWKQRCATLPPRSFMYVFNIPEDKITLSYGLDSLGYSDQEVLTNLQRLELLHENQRELLYYQILCLHEILLEIDYRQVGIDVYYAHFRAIKAADGNHWLAYQTSEPFQIDKNGRIVSYLSWYHILAPYQGEPVQTFMFKGNSVINSIPFPRHLKKGVTKIQDEQLKMIGFTKAQRAIIRYHDSGISREDMLAVLEITQKTLDGHNLKILQTARDYFPVNNFNNYKDVVHYLKRQGII